MRIRERHEEACTPSTYPFCGSSQNKIYVLCLTHLLMSVLRFSSRSQINESPALLHFEYLSKFPVPMDTCVGFVFTGDSAAGSFFNKFWVAINVTCHDIYSLSYVKHMDRTEIGSTALYSRHTSQRHTHLDAPVMFPALC